MNDLQIDNWVKEGILPAISEIDESQVKKIDENRLVLFKDMSDDDSYKDVINRLKHIIINKIKEVENISISID